MELVTSIASALLRVSLVLLAVTAGVYFVFLRPPREPRHIPAIPFWVTLLPLWKDVDQQVIYNQYIRKPLLEHGAVKIFFGSQWNVLIERPTFLAQIFKREDIYQKSGNQKKIPGSVLASFLGDNIISSHGDVWRLYREIMKPGLQEEWDMRAVHANAAELRTQLLKSTTERMQKEDVHCLALPELVQRYTIANIVQVMLHERIDMMHETTAQISRMQTQIKGQIFKPFFMSFPYLDTWGFRSREQARQNVVEFKEHLVSTLESSFYRHQTVVQDSVVEDDHQHGHQRQSVGYRLMTAWKQGRLTRQQLRDNVLIVFVAGQENPQLALLSTLYLLAKHSDIQEQLYTEFEGVPDDEVLGEDRLQSLHCMTTVIYESLRLMPPIGQLINRLATEDLPLGVESVVPKGVYLGYNSYATNRDPAVWGADAESFVPARWGATLDAVQRMYRVRRARAEFISFHGGRRACLGERFAILQLKMTLVLLIKSLQWSLDPAWADRMTPAGPLAPRELRLRFTERRTKCGSSVTS